MSIRETIQKTVMSWPGVTERPHRFGGIEFALGERELGHLHGDRMADLPFTRPVRDELIAAGRARPHHVLPDSGWVSYRLNSEADVPGAIALFRLSYERAVAAQRDRAERSDRHDRSPA
jgi:luciferase-like monooxygenase